MFNDKLYANAVLAHTERRREEKRWTCNCGTSLWRGPKTKTEIRRAPKSNHFRNSGAELRYSKACSDNCHAECQYDAEDCDCAHHFERSK